MRINNHLLGIVFCLSVSQALHAQDEHRFNFETVAGNQIAWSCEGSGSPTIVLIAGSGLTAHDSFGRTYHKYDGPGRICMYDRAGMGKSTFEEPVIRPLAALADELHELSEKQGWSPVILVPHSFGGWIARSYADRYPDEVAGILFLDSIHEDWLAQMKAKMAPADWAIMDRIVQWTDSKFREGGIFAAQADAHRLKLKDHTPITVLTRGIPHTQIRLERMSYEGIDIFENEHQAAQRALAKISANSEHRTARYASHNFDAYDPWLVIEEIKLLYRRVTAAAD